MALVLVALVISVAFGVSAPNLSVAEFAPSAQNRLDAPPPTDPGSAGRAAGSRSRRSTTTTSPSATTAATTADGSTPAAPTTRVGRSRRCYGEPPRQIEDPMSPPCVATIFEGDNGGATSKGVSSTEIRIAVPIDNPTDTWYTGPVTAIFDYLNERFEFYGRRLVPVLVKASTYRADLARAAAADIVAQGVFAAVTAATEINGSTATLPTTLARAGITTVARNSATWWTDRTVFDPYHPFIWSVFPSSEDLQLNLGDFACTALAGHPVAHSIDADLQGDPRRFAVMASGYQATPSAAPLIDKLDECTGVSTLRAAVGGSAAADYRVAMERVRADGATTLICVCDGNQGERYLDAARDLNFHPEWVFEPSANWTHYDEGWLTSYRERNWVSPMMRLDAGPRMVPFQQRPYFPALLPLFAVKPPDPGNWNIFAIAEMVYAPLLVLASGIQGAGPQLTADTFAQALMTTQFPNPGAGQAPYWQGSAGFGPGDHSFYDDYNVAWWSDTAEQFEVDSRGRLGSWCYLDRAARFGPGRYPADAEQRMFNSAVPCR